MDNVTNCKGLHGISGWLQNGNYKNEHMSLIKKSSQSSAIKIKKIIKKHNQSLEIFCKRQQNRNQSSVHTEIYTLPTAFNSLTLSSQNIHQNCQNFGEGQEASPSILHNFHLNSI